MCLLLTYFKILLKFHFGLLFTLYKYLSLITRNNLKIMCVSFYQGKNNNKQRKSKIHKGKKGKVKFKTNFITFALTHSQINEIRKFYGY